MAHIDDGARSSFKIFANIFISFIGSGILALPYAFKEAGVIEGSLILCIVGLLSIKAMLLLIDCKDEISTSRRWTRTVNNNNLNEEDSAFKTKPVEVSYGDLGFYALGYSGRILVETAIIISQTGFGCAYLIFITENLKTMVADYRMLYYLIILLPPLFLLVCLKSLKSLAVFSLFADFANVLAYGVVFWFDFAHFGSIEIHPRVMSLDGLAFFLGISIYCYEGAGMILELHASVAADSKDKFKNLFKISLVLITVLYIAFGMCGYLSFGPATNNIITLNLPPGVMPLTVKICLCFALFFTYPMMMFPVIHILEEKFLVRNNSTSAGLLLRAGTVLLTGVIVLAIPNFSTLMALVGSCCCTLLAFILPGWFHLCIFRGELTKTQEVLDYGLIVIGFIGTIIGTKDALGRLMTSAH
ncbi:Amino acid transporter ANTL1 [Trichoplax sp. H2]|nr:Amino acid transporter ANTL1 [Trichoplax sp. H2]|eukprot:RDD39475.1 Amino acid transporter ANTL1 [Trichoplax sp. H2]